MTRRRGSVVPPMTERGSTCWGIRFVALGKRRHLTTSSTTREGAQRELEYVLADVERGLWRPPVKVPKVEPSSLPAGRDPEFDDGFDEFAEAWLQRRHGDDLRPRTLEHLDYVIGHLTRHFGGLPVGEFTFAAVDGYRVAKIAERKQTGRGLSNRTLNGTLRVLAQILDVAVRDGLLASNPARDRSTRAKAGRPARTWLEISQLRALLDAAGDHRALLGVMGLAGLRVSEATALTWGDVDLANGRLRVVASKTDAGRRSIEMLPLLRDELASVKARTANVENDALLFASRAGEQLSRHSVRLALRRAVDRANVALAAAGELPIEGCTNHSLRRTFCALLFASGATLPEVIAQMGHTSPTLSLAIYSKAIVRQSDTTARADALLRGSGADVRADTHDAAVDACLAQLLDEA